MTPTTQTKILRVLQEGDIQRVGGVDTIKVNVRVVAATNKDLEALVKEKKFREDLYYRLNVVRVKLPPLRERTEDVPQIVDFFVQNLAKAKKVKARKVAPEALALLTAYPWPGNVRELENVVYRSAVAATGDTILPKDLPDEVREPKAAAQNGESLESLYDRLAKALRAQHPGEEMTTLHEAMDARLPETAPKKRAKK
jgi:two-component system nitrogen regulation response regulator GlnG